MYLCSLNMYMNWCNSHILQHFTPSRWDLDRILEDSKSPGLSKVKLLQMILDAVDNAWTFRSNIVCHISKLMEDDMIDCEIMCLIQV